MASVSPMECGVCNEAFNEGTRCPRILPCFHHLCTYCIEHLIDNNMKNCPFCRHTFVAQRAKDVRINIGVLDLVTFISNKAEEENGAQQDSCGAAGVGIVYATENTSNCLLQSCRDIESLIDISVEHVDELVTSLNQQNGTISTVIVNHFTEIMARNDGMAKDIKAMGDRVREQQNALKEKEEEVKISKHKLRSTDGRFTEDEMIREEAEEANAYVAGWVTGLKKMLSQDSDIREKMVEDIRETATVTEAVRRKLQNLGSDDDDSGSDEGETEGAGPYAPSAPSSHYAPSAQYSSSSQCAPCAPTLPYSPTAPTLAFPEQAQKIGFDECIKPISNLSPMDIHNRSQCSKQISFLKVMDVSKEQQVNSGMVMAVQQDGCKTRYSQISISNNKLHLHCLQVGSPITGATIIEHADALNLAKSGCKPLVVFLDLAIQRSVTLGRIYILLPSANLEGAQNFKILCTGELGPSYASTAILGVQCKGTDKEAIHGGDYEFNSGRGGKTLVKGLNLSDRKYKSFWKAGTVRGVSYKHFGQFYINTRDFPDTTCQGTIGKVIAGLDILKAIAKRYSDPGQIVVQDSGIVLPCPYLDRRVRAGKF